jgi:hypothetical protein
MTGFSTPHQPRADELLRVRRDRLSFAKYQSLEGDPGWYYRCGRQVKFDASSILPEPL